MRLIVRSLSEIVILIYSWIEIENVSLVDYLTKANKDQLLLGKAFVTFLVVFLTYAN